MSSPISSPNPGPVPPVVLAPDRWNRGAWLFRDSTLHSIEILLDEAFRIPGTGIRFGIDGIIGLVPGLGDVLAGLLSLVIPLAAWIRGVPYVTLVRMAVNLAPGRPTAATTACWFAISTSPAATPGATGHFSGCWPRLSGWSSPCLCCW